FPAIDPILTNQIIGQVINADSLTTWPIEISCRDLSETLSQKLLGLASFCCASALPVWFAVAVILDPPNRASLLQLDAATSPSSWHSLSSCFGHSSGISTRERPMNSGFSETQRICKPVREQKNATEMPIRN